MTLHWAHLSTSNFEFDAFAQTPVAAKVVLIAACKKHCAQHDVSWSDFKPYLDDVNVVEVKNGYAYRDRDSLLYDRERDSSRPLTTAEMGGES